MVGASVKTIIKRDFDDNTTGKDYVRAEKIIVNGSNRIESYVKCRH